ncbi:unnamed protein product, partial [Mesorhabditis belari]|uniref:Secreted protein n=1 Tax=Mesorhabditis belari TaxID=2138241 RepID=A0AAF3FB91_9BILA
MNAKLAFLLVVCMSQTFAANCPSQAVPSTSYSLIYGPANDETNGSKTCPRGFCRYITTSLGSSNACLDQSLVCPQATGPILSTTIAGPADSNLNCPATTKCVGGEATSNGKTYYGNFCVKA